MGRIFGALSAPVGVGQSLLSSSCVDVLCKLAGPSATDRLDPAVLHKSRRAEELQQQEIACLPILVLATGQRSMGRRCKNACMHTPWRQDAFIQTGGAARVQLAPFCCWLDVCSTCVARLLVGCIL